MHTPRFARILASASSRTLKPLALGLLASGALAVSAHAANRNTTADGNWTGAIWNATPATGDAVFVRNNVTVSTAVSPTVTVAGVTIGDFASSTTYNGTVTISSGGVLTSTATTQIARNLAGAGNGTLILSGGTYNATAINVGVGTTAGSVGVGNLTIQNGGVLNASGGLFVGATAAGVQSGSLHINGSTNSSINMATLLVRLSGSAYFTADAAGFSTLHTSSTASFSPGSSLVIVGASYTCGTQTWTLIDAGGTGTYDSVSSTATITGFNSSLYTTNLFVSGNDLNFTVTAVAIPEPATASALLGGLALAGIVMKRRRSRR